MRAFAVLAATMTCQAFAQSIFDDSVTTLDDQATRALQTRTLIVSDVPTGKLSDCAVGCAVCMEASYDDAPDVVFGECTDWRDFRYANICGPDKYYKDTSLCNTEEMKYCFAAYPQASPKKWRDPDLACRTVLDFNRNLDFPWEYAPSLKPTRKGLCIHSDDPDRQCSRSWDPNHPKGKKGNTNMFRVRKDRI